MEFSSRALSEALVESSGAFGFNVAFDSKKLSAVIISGSFSGNTVGEYIDNLLEGTDFEAVLKHGSYLIIDREPEKKDDVLFSCDFRGTVVDDSTGERLVYASVSLPSERKYIYTGEDGTFSFPGVNTVSAKLMISFVGYYSIDTTVACRDAGTYRMARKAVLIDTVGVYEKSMDVIAPDNNLDFTSTVRTSEIADLAIFSGPGIFMALQLMPGISQGDDVSELSIRGSTGDQNMVLLDGQTLYNLSHYFGTYSSVNPYFVKEIQVYKGGFDSRYGERISGIVDIKGKTADRQPRIFAGINRLTGSVEAEVPLGRKISFIAAGRYSLADVNNFKLNINDLEKDFSFIKELRDVMFTRTNPSFKFYDLNSKIDFNPDNNDRVSFSIYNSRDIFLNSYSAGNNMVTAYSNDTNRWNNYGVSMLWERTGKELNWSLQAGSSGSGSFSVNETSVLPDTIQPGRTCSETVNNVADNFIKGNLFFYPAKGNRTDIGFEVKNYDVFYKRTGSGQAPGNRVAQSGYLFSGYMQDQFELKSLSFKPGIRVNYFSGTGDITFEPRISALLKTGKNLSVRVAAGRYRQFISQVQVQEEAGYLKNVWILANGQEFSDLRSNHYIAGMSYTFKNYLFDAEVYYKGFAGIHESLYDNEINRIPVPGDIKNIPSPVVSLQPSPTNELPDNIVTGKGYSRGFDLLFEYRSSFYTGWISYSHNKSRGMFDEINNGDEIPLSNEKANQVSVTNMFKWGKWNFSTTTFFSSGNPYFILSEGLPGVNSNREYRQMPDYFRTDMSAGYTYHLKKLGINTGFSVYNLFNTVNYLDITSRKFQIGGNDYYETSLIPARKIFLNFYLNISL